MDIALRITTVMTAIIFAMTSAFGQTCELRSDSILLASTDIESDSISGDIDDDIYKFKPTQLILPGSLIAIGAAGLAGGWIKEIKNNVSDAMNRWRGDKYFHADDYVQYLPIALYLTLGEIKCVGGGKKHDFYGRFLIGATAYLSMGVMVNVTKWCARERRPDSQSVNSFPSGHTATAFMGAELMRMEYGTWWGVGSYAVATSIAFLRLYNNRHWINDVIAGAGMGILSARIGYWLMPLYRKWFKRSFGANSAVALMPQYNHYEKSVGIAAIATF